VIGVFGSDAKVKLLERLGCDRLLDLFYLGKLKVTLDPTVFRGIESIPDAVEHLLSGQNCGKVVVKY
jgi:NADPH-dependent curcumin reductase CurA